MQALDDLTLSVPSGSITVLLGPNGAGKTTSVRVATGALRADAGRVRVLGLDPSADGSEVRRRCGVIPPKPAFYDQLTGRENLAFAARVFETSLEPGLEAARRFGVEDALDRDVAGYSTGMRTRLALARAVVHDPEVLLLDEPTAGLDPESSRSVLELIGDLARRGRTVLMCTHLLHEAEGVADRVVLLSRGTVRAAGPPSELAGRYLARPVVRFDAEDRESLRPLAAMEGVLEAQWGEGVRVTLDSPARLADLVAALVGRGARLTRVEPVEPTLEALYFEMQRSHGGPS